LEDDFCSLCGLRLPGARGVAGEPSVEQAGRVLDEYAPIETGLRKPGGKPPVRRVVLKKCPNCNTPVREDLKFCPNCGFNLEVARMRLRRKTQGAVAQTYSRRDFFSFEGYQLEGVPMTALMLIIWAAWSICVAAMASIGWIQLTLPPPMPSEPLAITVFNILVGVLSILSAIGLLMVLRPLFYFVIILIVLEVPVSVMQLMQAATFGGQVWENFATGLVGLFIIFGLLIQLLRIHKYFTGTRV
jgi:hypothetical protein